MGSFALVSSIPFRRLSLAVIDGVVTARLGPTQVQGNAQPACFNRQVAMYLAKYVAGWSTTCIGRSYNDRDHSTVIYGIQRIQALRESDPEVDALLSELKHQLVVSQDEGDEKKTAGTLDDRRNASCLSVDDLAEAIAERVCARIEKRLRK